jgi:hypothetical protein
MAATANYVLESYADYLFAHAKDWQAFPEDVCQRAPLR